MNNLEHLGFDNWFSDKVNLSQTNDFKIVRVTSVNKNSFVVSNGVKDIYAELTGKFNHSVKKEIKDKKRT
jgi:hypothetical protein